MTNTIAPTVTDAKLLPCPFCAADMRAIPKLGGRAEDMVGIHPATDCLFSGCGIVKEKWAAWNTRTPASPTSDDVELRVAEAIWSERRYHFEGVAGGFLAAEHPDDIERAKRQARAAITAMQPPQPDGDGRSPPITTAGPIPPSGEVIYD